MTAAGIRPLEGVRIVDLTTLLMGPSATGILADCGADVIKVEAPGGDIMRHAGRMKHPAMGPIHLQANRGKRSIVVDLKNPQGREALLGVLREADLLVHNVRPAAMRRLGLDYADVAAINPGIVYMALVGYDQRGPYAAMPAVDDVIQGACGLASLFTIQDGGPPRFVPMVMVDRICGINAAQVALAALFMRQRTGRGQYIEVPMFETMAQLVLGDHLGGETFDPPAGEMGYDRLLTPFRRPFETSDGHVAVLVYTDAQWQGFFAAIGSPETFHQDDRFTTAAMRAKNFAATSEMLAGVLRQRSTADWVELLRRHDIPCMPVNTPRDLLDDPQLAATGFFEMTDHPTEGRLRMMRVPARWSDADLSLRSPAPSAGQHSTEVLREAGFDEASIAALLSAGAVVQDRESSVS